MEELNNQHVVTCKNRLCGKQYCKHPLFRTVLNWTGKNVPPAHYFTNSIHDRRSQFGGEKKSLVPSGTPKARYYRVFVLKKGMFKNNVIYSSSVEYLSTSICPFFRSCSPLYTTARCVRRASREGGRWRKLVSKDG